MEKYDYIISIGSACFTSNAIRKANCQFKSFPFDWLSSNSIYDNLDFICNGFQNFFNKEDLINTNETNGKKKNSCFMYKNNITNITYPHDFSIQYDFETAYKKANSKYERRINRLNSCLSGNNKVLFVFVALPNETEVEFSENLLVEKINKICDKFNNQNIELLVINQRKNIKYKERKYKKISKNIKIVEFDFSKYSKKHKMYIGKDSIVINFLKKEVSLNIPYYKKLYFIFFKGVIWCKKYLKLYFTNY